MNAAAVVFDLDGVLVDSEHVWDAVREELAHERGGRWHPGAQRDMMGMSSPEWSRYMHERIGSQEPPDEINRIVVERMLERYANGPPWMPGALDAVLAMASAYTLALASSSNRELIETVLGAGGIRDLFAAAAPPRRCRAGSRHRTSTWRRPGDSVSTPPRARPSRTHTTASAPPRPPGWGASRSPTNASRRAVSRPRPTSCSARSGS